MENNGKQTKNNCFSSKDRKKAHVSFQTSESSAQTAVKPKACETRLPAYALPKISSFNPCTGLFNSQKISRKRNQSKETKTIQTREWARLQNAAKVVTLEEQMAGVTLRDEERKRLASEAAKTKQRFKQMDDARKKAEAEGVSGTDVVVAEKTKILDRAFLAKQEQEEEVKRANRIILDAKCHAVLDAQVQEKLELKHERIQNDMRLESIVLENAKKSLSEEDDKANRQKEEKQKYAREIQKQLDEQDNQRFLEGERIEQESARLRRANEAIKRDEERQKREANERCMKYRLDLAKAVEMSKEFRRVLLQQEKESEMRIEGYMREKEEKLRGLQKEAKLAKKEFERKQERIYNVAEKLLVSKSDREELQYQQEREKNEREYRQKEKAAALSKRQIERELAEARKHQVQEAKYRQALQIARAEQDFNTLIKRMKNDAEKERKKEAERRRRSDLYRSDIVQQMGDNEMEQRRLKEMAKQEGDSLRQRERDRMANIQAVINAKLDAMRDACLPQIYISDVEKQLSRPKKK